MPERCITAAWTISEAAVEATRRRFRPIVMTSFAFILGVIPLLVAFGAGAASQQAIGTVVFGGMLASTLLAIPFVPVFYVIFESFSERVLKRGEKKLLRNDIFFALVRRLPRNPCLPMSPGVWPSPAPIR